MKNFLFVFAFIVFTALGYSQSSDPVKWATSVEKISDTEYDLVTKATIESGWHLYSQLVSEGGPTATSFIFTLFRKETHCHGNHREHARCQQSCKTG